MSNNLEASLIRVLGSRGETKDTGFIVSSNLAVTCAHVIEDCKGAPGSRVLIRFHLTGEEREALVVEEFWQPVATNDIAFLRLLPENKPLPKGVSPVTLGTSRDLWGHNARVVGFAKPSGFQFDRMHFRIDGPPVPDAQQNTTRLFLTSGTNLPSKPDAKKAGMLLGMSGAPVIDVATDYVVGVFASFQEGTWRAYAIPSDTLKSVCPEIYLVSENPITLLPGQSKQIQKGILAGTLTGIAFVPIVFALFVGELLIAYYLHIQLSS